jgi:uncharacterized protein YecT (DUF1311 family)
MTRTYGRDELRRRPARRRRAPIAVAAALTATFVLGAGLGLAVLHGPPAKWERPALLRRAPPPLATADLQRVPPLAEPTETPAPTPANLPLAYSVTAPAQSAARPAIAVAKTSTARRPSASPARRQPPRDEGSSSEDPPFAALDEELNKAFADAIRAGAPAGDLSAEQENWIIRRDRIRRNDPALAEDLYRARIAELQALSAHHADLPPSNP